MTLRLKTFSQLSPLHWEHSGLVGGGGGRTLAGVKHLTHTWSWSLFPGSTSGAHRQRLWAAVPFTFALKTLDVVLFMIHFQP